MRRIFSLFLLSALLLGVAAGVTAAEVDSDTAYCFTAGDFGSGEALCGICITALPDAQVGTILLGNRVLQNGDILTAEQIGQMTFVPLRSEEDRQAVVTYLPIYADRVAPSATMTVSVRGKADKAPVALDSTLETYKNLSNSGTLSASDPEGSALTYTVTRSPRRGDVTVYADGTYTYTPKKNKVGTDSFTYTVTDEGGKVSREATVTITVLKADSGRQYTDTMGSDSRFAAEWLKNNGLFVGETINAQLCFQPEKSVSRGEFTAMLVQTLKLAVDENATYTGFDDEVPTWLRPYLAAAMRCGLTAGWPYGTTFGANETISGAEAALMLQNALDLPAAGEPDTDTAPAWAATAIAVMAENGLTLRDAPMTRAEAAQVLYRTAALAADAPGMQVFVKQ